MVKLAPKTKPQSERKQIIIQLKIIVENKMPKTNPNIPSRDRFFPAIKE